VVMALFKTRPPEQKVESPAQSKENPFIVPGRFTDEELPIAEKIQQRRIQMLIHSYIYYRLDKNLITDQQFDA
jgi:hypothetical protein